MLRPAIWGIAALSTIWAMIKAYRSEENPYIIVALGIVVVIAVVNIIYELVGPNTVSETVWISLFLFILFLLVVSGGLAIKSRF